MNTVILCGGRLNFQNLPLLGFGNNSMVPVNGKPVIGWIIDDILEKGCDKIIVVFPSSDKGLADYVKAIYSQKVALSFVQISKSVSILHSLYDGMSVVDLHTPTQIILGDTLVRDRLPIDFNDYVFVGSVSEPELWCTVSIDKENCLLDLFDKMKGSEVPRLAICGYYNFADSRLLLSCVKHSLDQSQLELSFVIEQYKRTRKMKAVNVQEWFDFGNIDNLLAAKQKLIQSRFFNTLTVNPVLNTITKISVFDDKLRDELDWYKNLPDELKILTPRIVSSEIVDNRLRLVSEYYGYSNLSEIALFSSLTVLRWNSIFRQLFNIHNIFRSYKSFVTRIDVIDVYINKTKYRLEQLTSDFWRQILAKDSINVNGILLQNINALWPKIEKHVSLLAENVKGSIIHGDFCFSNILYDTNNNIVRLIDPRGSFSRKGIYGDPRYDIAKLRHSISGNYDYFVSDLFNISMHDEDFILDVFINDNQKEIAELFDNLIVENYYDLKEVKLIEGLLFISMIPLHKDYFKRQQAMYCRGLMILNEVLCE